MVYEIPALVFLAALWRKGSLRRLTDTSIRYSYLIITCLLIQVAAMLLDNYIAWVEGTFFWWITLSYLMLAFCCWANRQLPGFLLFGSGLLMNFLVISANGGRMPVSEAALHWAGLSAYIPMLQSGLTKHQLLTEATRLVFLADIIPLRPPFVFGRMVVSVGDLAVTIGFSRFLYKRMTR